MIKIFPRPLLALITIILVIASIYWIESTKVKHSTDTTDTETSIDLEAILGKNPMLADISPVTCEDRPARKIVSPAGFVNTGGEPVTIEEYIGEKVILIDFMTYSCINCQRTFPYLNAWHKKYKDSGLQVIGIHTPEFEFEKDKDNVERAANKFGIEYPLVLDNNYGTWRAYNNRYWPRKYIIDIRGCIVYDHIGEGAYEETEKVIQKLLQERNEILDLKTAIPTGIVTPEATKGSEETRTPEIYFGADRNSQYLANGVTGKTGIQDFTIPEDIRAHRLYLEGKWEIKDEFAEAREPGASIVLRYKAKNVYSVMSAPVGSTITIYQDDKLIKKIEVHQDDLYRIIENDKAEHHLLKIEVNKPGLRAFTFTFG